MSNEFKKSAMITPINDSISPIIDDFSFIEDDLPLLIDEGLYKLKYLRYETYLYKNIQPKIKIIFCILDQGKWHGEIFTRHYNVKKLRGKIGINGNFTASRLGKFLREFYTIFPDSTSGPRQDRIPMSKFKNNIILGQIRAVTHDENKRHIPYQLQYSTIERLIKVIE